MISLDKKQRIYVHDNGNWMVKGHFEKAFAKNSKINWNVKDDDYSLAILVVILYDILNVNSSDRFYLRHHLIIPWISIQELHYQLQALSFKLQ